MDNKNDKLYLNIKNILSNQIFEKKNINFELVIQETILEFQNLISENFKIDENYIINLSIKIKERKQSWIRSDKCNKSSIYRKYLSNVKESFEFFNTKIIDDCKNYEEVKEKLDNQLKYWLNNADYSTTYRYLESRKKNKIIEALKDDILLILSKNYLIESNEGDYEEIPRSINLIPVDTSNRLKLNKNSDEYEYLYETDKYKYRYTIQISDIKEVLISDQLSKIVNLICSVINSNDILVFNYIIKKKTKNFFQDGIVDFELKEICMDLYGYYATRSKNKVIASLHKMAYIKVEGISNNSKLPIIVSLLGDVVPYQDSKNVQRIKATVGMVYRQEIINGNTVKIHSNVFKLLEDNNDARKIIFYLQSRRIFLYYQKDKNMIDSDYYVESGIHYTELTQAIMINEKRVDRVIKRLNKALDTIIDTGKILLSYSNTHGFYKFIYEPMTNEEVRDLENRLNINDVNFKEIE